MKIENTNFVKKRKTETIMIGLAVYMDIELKLYNIEKIEVFNSILSYMLHFNNNYILEKSSIAGQKLLFFSSLRVFLGQTRSDFFKN